MTDVITLSDARAEQPKKRGSRSMMRLLKTVVAVAIVNFIAFVIIAILIGGDAWNGKMENGRYFVANHGRLTEVSASVFTYSLWHVRCLFVTHLFGMVAGGWIAFRRKRRLPITN
ncbi:hypothetical protein [Rhodopila sp.]|uniref:hypothetical protein n=1 Tax=Rhodopila sp. TaxID=2480087 RepID=UPI003D0B6A2F